MKDFNSRNDGVDFDRAVMIDSGVWWVGFQDRDSGLRCNPYLIIEGDEAVLLDGGSRPDFPVVMMKILETGFDPRKITALIYDHSDPDLCGNIPNLEQMIARPDLKLICDDFSGIFIRHYNAKSEFVNISDIDFRYTFATGRTLEFITTPYCHTRGSFVVYDAKTKILLSGDLFGTYDPEWRLFLGLAEDCAHDRDCKQCRIWRKNCPITECLKFHSMVMPCKKALRMTLKKLKKLPFEYVAPQHGSIIDRKTADVLIRELEALEKVGIDCFDSEDDLPAANL